MLMVFLFGLGQTHLSGSYFISTLFITINGVVSLCFETYMITINKVTRLRVRISKSTIKSIFIVFSLWFERHTPFSDLFYFNIVYYYQWCQWFFPLVSEKHGFLDSFYFNIVEYHQCRHLKRL